ncbi:MAG: MFS transporter [Betaproteobacteria bacterium]|nr:MFS transporter [Betaproteobacteria bacterium]
MNRPLWLLTLAQGLFFTNNVTFIAINGLVGLSLAPVGWMATLPVMGYVVGSAMSTALVSRTQAQWGRKKSFQTGLVVAFLSCAMALWALLHQWFWLLVVATLIAGYYSANAQLYRFAAAELAPAQGREKAVSWVMAGGLMGAILGPNLANQTKNLLHIPFAGAYLCLMGVAVLAWLAIYHIDFGPTPPAPAAGQVQRSWASLMRQPVFLVAALSAALGYGVMNLLMAATPLAMQTCGIGFADTAFVLQWHVIGMFAPGFFTGHLIKRFGALPIMGVGVLLNAGCVVIALSGIEVQQFLIALLLLGVGWNFLFTGSTTLSLEGYAPQDKHRAQAVLNFCVFATMAVTSFASGALVTTSGWDWLNLGSLLPIGLTGVALLWLARLQHLKSASIH